MKLIVWKIVGKKEVKYGINIGNKYLRVAMKSLDEYDKQTYYLNLPENYGRYIEWIQNIQEGNILDVDLQQNKKNVNYFNNYTLIKKV